MAKMAVRHMSCTISVRLSVAKALEKHVRSPSFSISLFQRKFTFTWKIYWTVISITTT